MNVVRPLAKGAFLKLDSGLVTLDLPSGIAVVPGSARLMMVSRNTGRTRNERSFPLLPVGDPVEIAGGGSRVTLSPPAAQGAGIYAFLKEGGA